MKKIVLIGASSYIAGLLHHELSERNFEVFSYSTKNRNAQGSNGLFAEDFDLPNGVNSVFLFFPLP